MSSKFMRLAPFGCGLVVFLLLMKFSISPYFETRPGRGASEAEFSAQLDRAAPRILQHFEIAGVVVATVVDGVPSRTYAYGFADLKQRRRMTPDTVFRASSLSKSLTAWGVLRLVQRGAISLDAPVQRYLGRWPLPPSAYSPSGVTVRRLLNHTAGLNAGRDSYQSPDRPSPSGLALLRGEVPGTPAAALIERPGSHFMYSVPGYTLLQSMIEDQAHEPFADYMNAEVLKPLGMNSSSFRWDQRLRARTATPYVTGRGASRIDVPQDAAADSLFTTAPDLARFIADPLPGKRGRTGFAVLNADSVSELYRDPVQVPSLRLSEFGRDLPTLGYFLERAPGAPMIVTNGGLDPGWSSRIYIVPETGDGIAILTNSDRAQPVIARIASIWSAWRGLPPTGMTRAYRTLGVEASAALSLLVTLALSLAVDLSRALTRRDGARTGFRPTFAATAVECLLAISSIAIWLLTYRAVQTLPVLNTVGTTAIGAFTGIVIARLFASFLHRPQWPTPLPPARLSQGACA